MRRRHAAAAAIALGALIAAAAPAFRTPAPPEAPAASVQTLRSGDGAWRPPPVSRHETRRTAPARASRHKATVSKIPAAPANLSPIVALGRKMAARRGWTGREWDSLYRLWNRESGWRPDAVNRRSGACGIPQFHPCKGPNGRPRHLKRPALQIADGLAYISRRYGTPSKALAVQIRRGWY